MTLSLLATLALPLGLAETANADSEQSHKWAQQSTEAKSPTVFNIQSKPAPRLIKAAGTLDTLVDTMTNRTADNMADAMAAASHPTADGDVDAWSLSAHTYTFENRRYRHDLSGTTHSRPFGENIIRYIKVPLIQGSNNQTLFIGQNPSDEDMFRDPTELTEQSDIYPRGRYVEPLIPVAGAGLHVKF